MPLHPLAKITIEIEGYPEYTGTDDELQELIEEAEALLISHGLRGILLQQVQKAADEVPYLPFKVRISIKGP